MSQYTIPYVVERSPRGERTVDVYSRLLSGRIVYLGTEIDDGVANAIVAQLLHLQTESPEQPIDLYLNSPGGSLGASLAIYDTMQYIACPVSTTCVGEASSGAALLLAGGEKGRRQLLRHSRVLLHQPAARSQGTLPDLEIHAREVMRMRNQMEAVLAEHTGQTTQRLRHDTDRDKIFDAEGAIAYGLADVVIDSAAPAPNAIGR